MSVESIIVEAAMPRAADHRGPEWPPRWLREASDAAPSGAPPTDRIRFAADEPGRPVPLISQPWRLDIAAWPAREWSRWRKIVGLLIARSANAADVAAIHRAEVRGYAVLVARRPGTSTHRPRPVPWRDVISSWPIPERERWAALCDRLQDRGREWRQAEALAFCRILIQPRPQPAP